MVERKNKKIVAQSVEESSGYDKDQCNGKGGNNATRKQQRSKKAMSRAVEIVTKIRKANYDAVKITDDI